MTKGKVVLVPFPFDDLSAARVRPAVCLTNSDDSFYVADLTRAGGVVAR